MRKIALVFGIVVIALLVVFSVARPAQRRVPQFDVLIRSGRIVDGSGGPWFRGDVGIVGDRIAALGTLVPPAADHDESDPRANAVVDAAGLVVAPGFVDFHSHSDVSLLADPRAESAVRQGVTTQLVGNC